MGRLEDICLQHSSTQPDFVPNPKECSECWLISEVESLRRWTNDLQSGMYVNCVYCGHRYGPKETTPVTMADALKEHIEQCSKHPMSSLKRQLAQAQVELKGLAKMALDAGRGIGEYYIKIKVQNLIIAAKSVLDNDDPQDWPACYHFLEDAIKRLED